MIDKVILLFLFTLLFSCGKQNEPNFELIFKADFNSDLIGDVEEYFYLLAAENEFRVYQKDRIEMKKLSSGKEAFFIAFYRGKSKMPTLWVTNVGSVTTLTLSLHTNSDYGKGDVRSLSNRIVKSMRSEYNINFQLVESD